MHIRVDLCPFVVQNSSGRAVPKDEVSKIQNSLRVPHYFFLRLVWTNTVRFGNRTRRHYQDQPNSSWTNQNRRAQVRTVRQLDFQREERKREDRVVYDRR